MPGTMNHPSALYHDHVCDLIHTISLLFVAACVRVPLQEFAKHPIACLTLAAYAIINTGACSYQAVGLIPVSLSGLNSTGGCVAQAVCACLGPHGARATHAAQVPPAPAVMARTPHAPPTCTAANLYCQPTVPPPKHTACTACKPGDVARKWIRDPTLLQFIDLECYIWSTVAADLTPMINAGMVRGCPCFVLCSFCIPSACL